MHKLTRAISAVAVLIGMLGAAALQAGEDPDRIVEKISVDAAREFVAQHDDAVILDVRTPAEFELSHITGAINADVQNTDFESLVAGLDRNKTYLVHCTRNPENGRSSRALGILQSLGFENLYSLEGGYVAWKDASLPLTGADN